MERRGALTWARAAAGLVVAAWISVLLAVFYVPRWVAHQNEGLSTWDPRGGALLLIYLAHLLRRGLPVIGPLLLIATAAAPFWWLPREKKRPEPIRR